MKGFVLAALAVLIPCCVGSLIVGGKESSPHSRPYQVAIMNKNKGQFCGGTLVHNSWVVTAAHCSPGNGQSAWVGLGYHKINKHDGPNQQFVEGTWINHINFGYGGHGLNNDIALIELKTPVIMNSDVKAIGISSSEPNKGLPLLVSGWGNLDPSTWDPPIELNEVVVYANSHQECAAAYGSITFNMFCASVQGGGKDACQGDSGGPIVSNFAPDSHQAGVLLEGIVSWGYGCAEAAHPGVYTKISNYCDWIQQKTTGDVNCS
ncbi:trypsin-2-like [Asterias amurensis]|uniref:trypsin-2-like n=1 Tax=Asterias amurensis TaxID=7602 RepID=UPI003AB4831D